MGLTTILFDLDGTLLPMDNDEFTKQYFKLLAKKLAPHGYDPQKLIDGIWTGTAAMVRNDKSRSNEDAFWQTFASVMGAHVLEDIPIFNEFYENEFGGAKEVCGFNPQAADAVRRIRGAGYRVALATNPIFPAVATRRRIRWAGLEPEDFELYTTYENTSCCKPNPLYYQDICERLDISPQECLMVGNDVNEDMAAQTIGMQVFLHTDCLINREEKDIAVYPNGGFAELLSHLGWTAA